MKTNILKNTDGIKIFYLLYLFNSKKNEWITDQTEFKSEEEAFKALDECLMLPGYNMEEYTEYLIQCVHIRKTSFLFSKNLLKNYIPGAYSLGLLGGSIIK